MAEKNMLVNFWDWYKQSWKDTYKYLKNINKPVAYQERFVGYSKKNQLEFWENYKNSFHNYAQKVAQYFNVAQPLTTRQLKREMEESAQGQSKLAAHNEELSDINMGYYQEFMDNREEFMDKYKGRGYEYGYGYYPYVENMKYNDIIDDYWNHDQYERAALAQKRYGLDKLCDDPSGFVRAEVARQGAFLDKLSEDRDPQVRQAVALQGHRLDKLINDSDKSVRCAVALQGYGLDKLMMENDPWINKHINKYLSDNNYAGLADWAMKNPDKIGFASKTNKVLLSNIQQKEKISKGFKGIKSDPCLRNSKIADKISVGSISKKL